ncbi:AlpA family phage regulatory protein [Pleurocapsales cyanobacterium LEGE 10410]|nr:AlpA family phage regulatory protein [Pleurocapsales cyanobacterium LEGE 10410]
MNLKKLSELEEYFSVSRTTIWSWRNDPELKFPKPIQLSSNTFRFDESEIIEWVRNRNIN